MDIDVHNGSARQSMLPEFERTYTVNGIINILPKSFFAILRWRSGLIISSILTSNSLVLIQRRSIQALIIFNACSITPTVADPKLSPVNPINTEC